MLGLGKLQSISEPGAAAIRHTNGPGAATTLDKLFLCTFFTGWGAKNHYKKMFPYDGFKKTKNNSYSHFLITIF